MKEKTNKLVEKTKEYFYTHLKKHDDIFHLDRHLPQVEKWAKRLIDENPKADSEVVMLGVWLHDIAHYPVNSRVDHAIKGEEITIKYLENNDYSKDKLSEVAHCVRSHRCKDVLPATIEAKILACADSASHLTDSMYIDIVQDGRADYAFSKLERDYRDISLFPEIQKELHPLYEAWKVLFKAFVNL